MAQNASLTADWSNKTSAAVLEAAIEATEGVGTDGAAPWHVCVFYGATGAESKRDLPTTTPSWFSSLLSSRFLTSIPTTRRRGQPQTQR